jgi:hypothetical protein
MSNQNSGPGVIDFFQNLWAKFEANLSRQSLPADSLLPSTNAPGANEGTTAMYIFPELGTSIYDYMTGGNSYVIDFTLMQLFVLDSTGAQIGNPVQLNCDPILNNNIQSAMIFVSDADTKIFLNRGVALSGQKLINVFNFLKTSRITITPPSNKLPNTFDLGFVLSNNPVMPYTIDLQLNRSFKSNSKICTDAFTDVFIVHMDGYDNLTLVLSETANKSMDWQVLVSQDDVTYFVLSDLSFPTIAALGYQTFITNVKWHYYKVQVKNHVAGQNATASLQAAPCR